MTGKVVTFYSTPLVEHTSANVTDAAFHFEDVTYMYTPMQVATAVTLMVGIFQVIISFLKRALQLERTIENKNVSCSL